MHPISKITVALVLLFISTFIGYVEMHEKAHAAICEHDYGQPHINYGFLHLAGTTSCINETDRNFTDRDKLDMLNEIIGYNVIVIAVAVLSGSFLIAIAVLASKSRNMASPSQKLRGGGNSPSRTV